MRLGVSTACFYPQPLEEILPILAGLGVHAAEVFFNTESEFTSAFCARLAGQAREYGLDIVSVHPYTSLMEGLLLFSDYARRTEDGLAQYGRYFACAASLGARYFTFHGERNMGPPDDEARWERRCAVYERLCALASENGITLAQENVAWCRSREPAFLAELHRRLPALRYTLDIKQAHRAGRHPNEFIDAVGDRIVNLHINDFSEEESCLLPGEGEMDFADFFRRMRGAGYDGHALIEVYRANFASSEEMVRAIRGLERFAGR